MAPKVPSTLLALCLLSISTLIFAQENHISLLDHLESSKILNAEAIDAKLNTPISLEFDQTPFQEVMTDLAEVIGTNIILDQSASDDSLTPNQQITFRLKNVRLRTALKLLLQEHNATYQLTDGAVKIISLDVANDLSRFRRRIFDCRQLIGKIVENTSEFAAGMNGLDLESGFGSINPGTSSGGVFNQLAGSNRIPQRASAQDSTADHERLTKKQAASILLDTIRNSIHPDDWNDTNGDFSADMFGGLIIISASEDCLFDVQKFLSDLNETLDAKPAE